MTDHFAALGQPRRPGLDPEALRETFHRLSAECHPDVPGTGDAARFAAVNAAHNVLRDPVARLRHLLELAGHPAPARLAAPPADLADLFMEGAANRRRAEDLLRRTAAATSPLAQALLAGETAEVRRALADLIARLEAADAAALAAIATADPLWQEAEPAAREPLARLADRLAYIRRSLTQLRETAFALRA